MEYPWKSQFLSISLYVYVYVLSLSLTFLICNSTQLSPSNKNNPMAILITDDDVDVHDLLPEYGFPKGLIPKTVKSYTISAKDGSFVIELETSCYVHFDDLVYYDNTIKGKLSYGSITDVSGIQAKKLFVWVPVTEIHVDSNSGMIEFYVGPFSEKFPAKQFENIPNCSRKASQEYYYSPDHPHQSI